MVITLRNHSTSTDSLSYSMYEMDDTYDYSDLDSLLYLHEQMQVPDNPFSLPTIICGALMSLVASIGVIGNVLSAYIFSRKTMGRASIGVLLTGLAITDALLLVVAAPLFASSAIYVSRPGFRLMTALAYMTAFVYPVASVLQTASVWLMMVTTLERYLAVCKPFLAISLCTRHRAKKTVMGVLAAGTIYNMCRFWEYTPTALDKANSVIAALPGQLRENQTYILVYVHWMYFMFIFAIPFLVLSMVNLMVIMTIRRARRDRERLTRQQRKEHATATMMIVVACAYLACTSLAFVLNAMELWGASGGRDVELPQVDLSNVADMDLVKMSGNHTLEQAASIQEPLYGQQNARRTTRRHSSLFYFLIDLNNLLVMIHCSVNFLIYYKFNRRFRCHVRALLSCDFGRRHGSIDVEATIEQSREETKPMVCHLNSSCGVDTFYYGSGGRTPKLAYAAKNGRLSFDDSRSYSPKWYKNQTALDAHRTSLDGRNSLITDTVMTHL